MDNILHYPQSCFNDEVIPKAAFYRFLEVNNRMKTHFVNDVVNITWLYKLAPSKINVSDSDDMKEIEVFAATLKSPDCAVDLFSFIDSFVPQYIVFILLYEGKAMILVNYKDWADNTHTKFKIRQTFTSPWVPVANLNLPIDGLSLPAIYDNFVAFVSGIGEHQTGTLADIVELKQSIARKETELSSLESKMRKEKQFNLQMQMFEQVKAKRQELAELKDKLKTLH